MAFYLGWSPDGTVVEARDKADVEEVLAHRTKPNADMMAMVARVDRTKRMWIAGAIDYTGPLLGVSSRGYFAAIDIPVKPIADPASIHTVVTLVFPSPADAKRAAAAIDAVAQGKRFSAALQAQLAKLHPTLAGADLGVDLAPLMTKPELFGELTQAITDAAARKPAP